MILSLRALCGLVVAGFALTIEPLSGRAADLSVLRWSRDQHGGAPVSFAIAPHPITGFVYVANAAGILEGDGVRWRMIAMPGGGEARHVVIDDLGHVWAARSGEIARLQPGAHGELEAISQRHRLPSDQRPLVDLTQAFSTTTGAGFVAGRHVLLFEASGEARVLTSDSPLESACWMDGAVHAGTAAGRFFRAQPDGTWRELPVRGPIEAGDLPGARRVLGTGTSADGRPLLLTRRGPLVWDSGEQSFKPATRAPAPFARRTATAAAALPDGGAVFAFPRGEVFQLDRDGAVTRPLADLGLGPPDTLAVDRDHGLWLARPPDLVRVQLSPAPATPPIVVVRRLASLRGHPLVRTGDAVTLPSDDPSLHAVFAAGVFGPGRLEFRSRLEGHDAGWSEWSQHAERDWSNLPRGALLLRVQARRESNLPGPITDVVLHVPLAWWARPSNFASLLAVAAGGAAGLVFLRSRTLRRRAARLEAQVADRTAALAAQNTELKRLRDLELDALATARLSEEKARLQMLRFQLNPHFLHNALNSIYALVRTDPAAAGDMVVRLSAFCRATLTRSDDRPQTLGDEIEVLRTYLGIEQARWNEELSTTIELDPAAAAAPLPPFLLLPLVENAVKYGSRSSPGVLAIRVTARGTPAGGLVISVANTGAWVEPAEALTPTSTGLGLENLRQRLERHFPGRHALARDVSGGWVVFTLTLDGPPSPLS